MIGGADDPDTPRKLSSKLFPLLVVSVKITNDL